MDRIQVRKIVDLYAQMVFWAVLFYILTVVTHINSLSFKEIVLVFIPFLGGRRWFVETYILWMLFLPFINVLIRNLNKKSYMMLIVLWVLVYSVWPSFLLSPPSTDNGYGLLNFITIYLIVGYVKLHIDSDSLAKKRNCFLLMWGISALATILWNTAPAIIGNNNLFSKICGRAWNYDFIFNISASISLTFFFVTMKVKPSKIVNIISSTTFGVFLIHSDFSLRKVLYQDILHCNLFYHSSFLAVHMVTSVVIMFFISMLLEICRKKMWSVTVDKWIKNSPLINKDIRIK